jgi:hypothetical protein
MSHLQLAGWSHGAVDGCQQQILAGGEALLAFSGQMGVEQRDQLQLLGDVEQGGDIGKGSHLGFQGLGRAARLA